MVSTKHGGTLRGAGYALRSASMLAGMRYIQQGMARGAGSTIRVFGLESWPKNGLPVHAAAELRCCSQQLHAPCSVT
jgi:hypothetical protein